MKHQKRNAGQLNFLISSGNCFFLANPPVATETFNTRSIGPNPSSVKWLRLPLRHCTISNEIGSPNIDETVN